MKKNIFLLSLLLLSLASCVQDPIRIIYEENASEQINLAAKELRRYIYQCTGAMPVLVPVPRISEGIQHNSILLKEDVLGEEEFHIQPEDNQSVMISGGSPLSILYGVYRYIEEYGVRYYLHGDVIPDRRQAFIIPTDAITEKPLFKTRGILPFHDFPEGPDWWDADDYKAHFTQMVKMRMNFFGLHTYPDHSFGPEPTTWIGLPEDVLPGGEVKFGHRAKYNTTTMDLSWGYYPKKTSDYYYGGGSIFEHDNYTTELMVSYMPLGINEDFVNRVDEIDWPDYSLEKWAEMFNEAGYFFKDVFDFARLHGIKTCIGTETPLTIPDEVKERLEKSGMDPDLPESIKKVYQGIFSRIANAYPLDYYWFWTPENWTWGGNSKEDLEKTKEDILLAMEAIDELGNPFTLATCGWVLGPAENRSMFDEILPRNIPMSCINRNVGFITVDPGFARIKDRDLWAIPWLEDDPAMIAPQFWAGRMRRDAEDALAYGCNGLIGIHWRTRVLGHNVSALARAGWQQDWNRDPEKRLDFIEAKENAITPPRDAPVDDFYDDWVGTQFGYTKDDALSKIFQEIDGVENQWRSRNSKIPRNSVWDRGPGGIFRDTLTWENRKRSYEFIDRLEGFRPEIEGNGNIDRFDYWLNTLKYHRAIGKFSCTLGEITRIEKELENTSDLPAIIEKNWNPLRVQLVKDFEEMNLYLLKTITTKGAMGNLSNLNQHVANLYFDKPGTMIENLTGEKLPENCWPAKKDLNEPRIFMSTIRSVVMADEDLSLKCTVTGDAGEPVLYFRKLGEKGFREKQMDHINRGVYQVKLTVKEMENDFEYYIKTGTNLYFPPTAPEICQAVVSWDNSAH